MSSFGGRILELEGESKWESCSKIALLIGYKRPGAILGGRQSRLDPPQVKTPKGDLETPK